jgi:hypothetical protein
MKPRFGLGRLLATPGALQALEEAGQSPAVFLDRHVQGDWGDVCPDDKQANEDSLVDGSRLLSSYKTARNVKLWIITEAADDDGHRVATTVLLPEEY